MSLFSLFNYFVLRTAFLRHIDYNIINNTFRQQLFFNYFQIFFILLKNPLFY